VAFVLLPLACTDTSYPIVDMITALAPNGVTIAVEPVTSPGGPHAEHAAGRRAATRALAALGVAGRATGDRGSRPTWPAGTVASISHAAGWAAAVAARTSEWSALGVDIDQSGALPAADALLICNSAERAALAELEVGPARDRWATLMWAIKEAAFKAYDTWTGGGLYGIDPAGLDVRCGAGGSATASANVPDLPALPRLTGRWAEAEGVVAVVIAARVSTG
jgi:4'-phosphopantetheinyl transferase EntD